jgi:hypothetical protein
MRGVTPRSRAVGGSIELGGGLFFAWLAASLFHRGLVWEGAGWSILALFCLVIAGIVLSNFDPDRRREADGP